MKALAGIAAGLTPAFDVDGLEHPAWLVLALVIAAVAIWLSARTPPTSTPWPALDAMRAAGARRFDPLRALALALRALALAALAVVLAGPVGVHRAPPEPGNGLDLLLAVDASGSMRALDAQIEGRWRTRLDLARSVVARFARERAFEGDRVGLVVFGETAFTQCPLTSDGALLAAALERVKVGVAGQATALGDGLALAIKRALAAREDESVAGRVVVLLTDGRNNAGAVSVEIATALARGEGIRVHTVGIGSEDDEVAMAAREGAAGRGLRFGRHRVDAAALERIAEATGGRFFAASRSQDLVGIYDEIDALERVPRPLPARVSRSPRPEPALALAGGLLLAEIALARAARRRLP